MIPVFIELLQNQEIPKFTFEAAWCLTNIASGKTEHVYALIEKNVVTHFVQLLSSPHSEIVDQAVWGLGNIAGDNIFARDQVINAGAVETLGTLLENYEPNSSLTRNATWTISNLCRGKPRAPSMILKKAISPVAKTLITN